MFPMPHRILTAAEWYSRFAIPDEPPPLKWWEYFSRRRVRQRNYTLMQARRIAQNFEQQQAELDEGRHALAKGDWVTFRVLVPRPNNTDRIESIVGVVGTIETDGTGPHRERTITIGIRSLPEHTDVHGFQYGGLATVPVEMITDISKPVPPTGDRFNQVPA